jgi:lipoate---protein ligase
MLIHCGPGHLQGAKELKQKSYVHKSGKLLKILLTYDEEQNQISSICITGDFFLYPEETLDKIEHNLIGVTVEAENIRYIIAQSLADSHAFGFDANSLCTAIMLCVRQDEKSAH